MRIEKRNYSRSPWRLVMENGQEVEARVPFEHPTLGWTAIQQPICGDTKAECVQMALDTLEWMCNGYKGNSINLLDAAIRARGDKK